jgi:hypothetical protein
VKLRGDLVGKGEVMTNMVKQKVADKLKPTRLANLGSVAATSAILVSAILKLAVNGALNQVWALINGMQVMVHMPLFKINFSETAMAMIK